MSSNHRHRHRLSREQAWEVAFHAVDHAPLMAAFGVDLAPDSLRLALTHRSFANENDNLPNNERLEFLGDAVLGLSIAGELYHRHPDRPESTISKMRASIVSRYGLADVAREINLGDHILLGKGEVVTGGRDKDSILADTTEALLGAIYLQYGFDATRDVILHLFARKIDDATSANRHEDWKTTLQERLAEVKAGLPEYRTTRVGPDHDLTFTAYALSGGRVLGVGVGGNKKTAEQQAAHQAYQGLNDRPSLAFEGEVAELPADAQ